MRVLAQELAPYGIRVNTVNPTSVNTNMIQWDGFYELIRPDLEHPSQADMAEAFTGLNCLPIPWIEPVDVSNAVLWLASDEARYITGVALPVDAGFCQKVGGAPSVLPE
jgi:(+)-trans-carveol dehydrogenase/(-)-trans-carveol dehydrogenase